MDIHFLGGATTVTGSRFLLTTSRATVLIDCGMFQGSPNESIRNRIPLGFDPSTLHAILITHAHLDHCGLLPVAVREGYAGPIYLTAATAELANLVLLDSGRLHEEFAKRESRWEARHPDRAIVEDREKAAGYVAALGTARAAHLPAAADPATPSATGGGASVAADGGASPAATPATDAGGASVAASGEAGPGTGVPHVPPADVPNVPDGGEPIQPAGPGDPKAAGIDDLGDPEDLQFAAGSIRSGEHVATSIGPDGRWMDRPIRDPEAELRAQRPELLIDLDAPLYTEKQAAAVMPLFRPIRYEQELEVAPGVHATFFDAGHILGSAIIRLRVEDADGRGERILVFSGDLGRPGTPILRDPTPMTDADYVFVESTYGGREHDPEVEAVRALAEAVREVDKAGGVLLIPSFAIGRTQEIVWELDRLIDRGEIPLLPLYLDSPMASKASDIYRRHPETYDEETATILAAGGTPLDYPDQRITNKLDDSKAIARSPRPYMIVASNGMLTGGRVVSHLRELIDDPSATILFVGYQGVGTLGSHLQAGATTVKIDGQARQVRCRIRSISGFSAHADESELLDWLRGFAQGGTGRQRGSAGYPRRVFLVHGDPEAQIALAPKVTALGFDVHVPRWHEQVQLD
ncbi:MAG: MBL fold metallo-hydrolase [Chloroflexi bacterium]|nr:MBL fold metallo-hydrolase [Chloroflexota bacterium]